MRDLDYQAMLQVAVAEARQRLAEGGIPIGAALFDGDGSSSEAGTIAGARMRSSRSL